MRYKFSYTYVQDNKNLDVSFNK